jgi:UDP-N-acetylmuramoyl-tripeptide--D-alanyl-D-alanine ligase
LAALTAAKHCGVSLQDGSEAVSTVKPFPGRMEPVTLQNGVTVIRDEYNGTEETFLSMLKVMKESQAARSILVISDISDFKGNSRVRQRAIGKLAAEHADVALFLSKSSHHAVKSAIQNGMAPENCHSAVISPQGADLLAALLKPGDLVFLKGRTTDHVTRVLFAQFGEIGCWKDKCSITRVCDVCKQLRPGFDLEKALYKSSTIKGV